MRADERDTSVAQNMRLLRQSRYANCVHSKYKARGHVSHAIQDNQYGLHPLETFALAIRVERATFCMPLIKMRAGSRRVAS